MPVRAPSFAAQEILQAIMERAAEKRIAGAFEAAGTLPKQPWSQALHEAKFRRANNLPPPQGFLGDMGQGLQNIGQSMADLGGRAMGGAQNLGHILAAAPGALYNDPRGTLEGVGRVGRELGTNIARETVRPFTQFNNPNVPVEEQGFDLASVLVGPVKGVMLTAKGAPVVSTAFRSVRGLGEQLQGQVPPVGSTEAVPGRISNMLSSAEAKNPTHTLALTSGQVLTGAPKSKLPYTNIDLLRDYPGLRHVKDAPPEQVLSEYLKLGSDNLMDLYERMPPELRDEAMQWYDGANEIAGVWSQQYGIPHASVSGTIAALSPQKDWFMNASLAQRVMDISLGKADQTWSGDMTKFLLEKPLRATTKADRIAAEKFVTRYTPIMQEIGNKSLDQLTEPTERGLFIRLFDEVNNPREYRTITPSGQFSDFALKDDGTLAKVSWGSVGEIGKADAALRSGGDLNFLSPLMGGKHKVRNFFNNISVPKLGLFGDTTIDTHATAALHYRPLAGGATEVEHSLATGKGGGRPAVESDETGVHGTYGFGQDATRLAAARAGLLPRQMQSITWEGVRSMFTPERKRNQAFLAEAENIWRRVDATKRAGRITPQQARDLIADLIERAGGVETPSWAR